MGPPVPVWYILLDASGPARRPVPPLPRPRKRAMNRPRAIRPEVCGLEGRALLSTGAARPPGARTAAFASPDPKLDPKISNSYFDLADPTHGTWLALHDRYAQRAARASDDAVF